MSFSYKKLKGRIIEKFDTLGKFAEALGIDATYLSRKLGGDVAFSQKEIVKWSELLDIPENEIGLYFFVIEVQKSEQKGEK